MTAVPWVDSSRRTAQPRCVLLGHFAIAATLRTAAQTGRHCTAVAGIRNGRIMPDQSTRRNARAYAAQAPDGRAGIVSPQRARIRVAEVVFRQTAARPFR